MKGYRLLTKPQVMAKTGLGRRQVDKMFADPGFPVKGMGKGTTKYVLERDLEKYLDKEFGR